MCPTLLHSSVCIVAQSKPYEVANRFGLSEDITNVNHPIEPRLGEIFFALERASCSCDDNNTSQVPNCGVITF